MTSIACTTVSSLYADRPPPPACGKNAMADRIGQAAESGAIGSTDATALKSALDSIDESLSSAGSKTSGTKRDPSAMKGKIDSLISDQVGAGALTSDQAAELKSLFAQGGKGGHGHGGPGGAGGPPPGPQPSGDSQDGTGPSNDTSALLVDFLKQLQASTSYASNGASSSSNTASSLVLDFDA